MQHEWGTALGILLTEKGLGPSDVLHRLKACGDSIAPGAPEDWLANNYVPGVRIWGHLNQALGLRPEEQAFLLGGVSADVPGEHERLEQLCEAARAGEVRALAQRLRTGVMIDRCGTSACVPLAEAVTGGHLEATRYLLEHGSDPNAREIGKASPLTIADKLGRGDLIRLLLDHGAYGHTDWVTGRCALHMLADHSLRGVDDDALRVQRVIKQGVSVNERYAGGPTPLIAAMRADYWRMCLLLLEHGATLHPSDGRAYGDLLDAAKSADPKLAKLIDAIDPRPKGPVPRWFNEARCQGIEHIEYVNERALTFAIDATDLERPLRVGEGDSGAGSALSPEEFLSDPSNAGRLEKFGLGWIVAYVQKMADGTRFGVSELLRGGATTVRHTKVKK